MGRLRTIKNANNIVIDSPRYLNTSDIKNIFIKPVYLEVGCGKGDFLVGQAINNPNNNYIGVEKYATVLLKTARKLELNKITNVWILNDDALNLPTIFPGYKFSGIYLNFSDPWPKKRHAKHRLTNPIFLNIYQQMLLDDKSVELKTDNESLFAYTLEVLSEQKNINVIYQTNDLYKYIQDIHNINNVASEYEKKFSQIKNINKITFNFKKK